MQARSPSKKVRAFIILFFFGFLGLQFYITFDTVKNWYPFSPYRMFSKNWPRDINMERIRYRKINGDILFPWELVRIPFFQANQMSFAVFLDLKNPGAKEDLCNVFKMPGLQVLREEVQYKLAGQRMVETIKRQGIVHECAQ